MQHDFPQLVRHLVGTGEMQPLAARVILLSLQEDAVDPLVDIYYAGVDEKTGVAILEILAEIGGPDALAVLRNVYTFDDEHPAFQRAAARGLLRNRYNLDSEELEDIARYVRDHW